VMSAAVQQRQSQQVERRKEVLDELIAKTATVRDEVKRIRAQRPTAMERLLRFFVQPKKHTAAGGD